MNQPRVRPPGVARASPASGVGPTGVSMGSRPSKLTSGLCQGSSGVPQMQRLQPHPRAPGARTGCCRSRWLGRPQAGVQGPRPARRHPRKRGRFGDRPVGRPHGGGAELGDAGMGGGHGAGAAWGRAAAAWGGPTTVVQAASGGLAHGTPRMWKTNPSLFSSSVTFLLFSTALRSLRGTGGEAGGDAGAHVPTGGTVVLMGAHLPKFHSAPDRRCWETAGIRATRTGPTEPEVPQTNAARPAGGRQDSWWEVGGRP